MPGVPIQAHGCSPLLCAPLVCHCWGLESSSSAALLACKCGKVPSDPSKSRPTKIFHSREAAEAS